MNCFARPYRFVAVGVLVSTAAILAVDNQCRAQDDYVVFLGIENHTRIDIARCELLVFPVGQPEYVAVTVNHAIRAGTRTRLFPVGIQLAKNYQMIVRGETVSGEVIRCDYPLYSLPPNNPLTVLTVTPPHVQKGRLVRKSVNAGQGVQKVNQVIELASGDLLEFDFDFVAGFEVPISDQGASNPHIIEPSPLGPRLAVDLNGLVGVTKEACFFRAKNRGQATIWVVIGDDTHVYTVRVR